MCKYTFEEEEKKLRKKISEVRNEFMRLEKVYPL